LILVRLRLVPASRCALGRRVVQGKRVRRSQLALVNGGITTQEGFASLRLALCLASGTQCKTDE
jgi:hypothetical protein